MFKHKTHGWITAKRGFVVCTPEYAKNYVIRRELVRCSADKQESAIAKALWIDSIPDIRKPEPKPESKPELDSKPKSNDKPEGKAKDKPKKKRK